MLAVGIRHVLPAAMAIGEKPDGICRPFEKEAVSHLKKLSEYLHITGNIIYHRRYNCLDFKNVF